MREDLLQTERRFNFHNYIIEQVETRESRHAGNEGIMMLHWQWGVLWLISGHC